MAQFKKKTSARYLVAKIDLRNIKPMSAVWSQCLTCGFGWKVLVSFETHCLRLPLKRRANVVNKF